MLAARETMGGGWRPSASEECQLVARWHRRPVAALAASALVWVLAWGWAIRHLSIDGTTLVVHSAFIATLAFLVPWVIASVEHRLLGAGLSDGFVLAAGASSVAFALLTLVPAADMRLRWVLLLGLAPVLVHVVAVRVLADVDRPAAASLATSALATAAVTALVWNQKVHVPLGELVWFPSDQREYAQAAHQLIATDLGPGRYPIGLPLVLAPYALLSDSIVQRADLVLSGNRLNVATLPTMLSITAVGFWLVARAAVASVGGRLRRSNLAVAGVPALVAALYILVPPDFVPDRNATLVPRRLLGLVFSGEPLTYLYTGAALLLVATSVHGERTWNPWLVGAASGFAVVVRESNIILVALVLGLLLTLPGRRRLVIATAVSAGVVMVVQAAYFLHVFGEPLMPNRDIYDGESWRPHARHRYGWESLESPPRMDPSYIQANLADVLSSYWPAVVLLLVVAAFVVVRHPGQWRTWTLAVVGGVAYVVFHAAYVHHVPIYRYNWSVVPFAAVLATAASASVIHGRSRSRAGR